MDMAGVKVLVLDTYLVAAGVIGERVLEVVFWSISGVVGTLSVSTMLERCPASGEVGKYSEPR
jgi:hypothetical protein